MRLLYSWILSVWQEAAWPRELQLHIHGLRPSPLPGSCGVRWGGQMSPSHQAVTAGGTQPNTNSICKVTHAPLELGDAS